MIFMPLLSLFLTFFVMLKLTRSILGLVGL